MMWFPRASSRRQQSSTGAGGVEENRNGEKKKFLTLKNPGKIWKNLRQHNQNHAAEHEVDCGETLQEEQREERLEEISRTLILREEQLFSQDPRCEEAEDQLQRDLEALSLKIWMAIHNTFTPSSSSASSSEEMEVLKSAVVCIQQQEEQDRRWTGCPEDKVPVWRPQKCLNTHNRLLQSMVESRLMRAAEEDSGETDGLSSPLKREVCRVGRRVKEDLLTVQRSVMDCYPPKMDILNLYGGLYHQSFSTRLKSLEASGLETDDCSYLLFWINHCYPIEILKHEELEGKIKTACLGSLLQPDHLDRLEDQSLTHKEERVKQWLNSAFRKEEESWLSGKTPELIDQYCFSPLAIDVIQVIDGSLTELSSVVRDPLKAQRLTAHLELFLLSYKKSLEEFVKGKSSGNIRSVVKAQLVCEQQFRGYITGLTGSLSEQQRCRCLETLTALRDCGYRTLTGTVLIQMKVCFSQLWTAAWIDGSLPVVDSSLDSLYQHLMDLTDLKPACREVLLSDLHQDLVLKYVKRMMKTRTKSRKQQVGGAQRMIEDAGKINDFFKEGGCRDSLWLGEMLCSLAEILRLQDPGSVQLEMVSLARTFPDLSGAHMSALLSLKSGLSAADVRSIRRSAEENRLLGASTNQSPPFFSRVKVKWINNKINQMGLKP
ncbi:tumor necrosis factor alpha-induced protein 2-like [Notolabrus celidotus]|uniref:tumor necrosis factor alpha-induced protein 2-like n=1 Tax=Notolabrus celidotus TaxID=1203425 RepID=UPI0014905E8D|nr:tumor necrosis factor alpha-induced protein 2-like [Notolabrus celidotus]